MRQLAELKPDRIVISPGPGTPEDEQVLWRLHSNPAKMSPKIPTLGVCLGHQGIINTFGGKVIQRKKLMHGKTCTIKHDEKGIFTDVATLSSATRYHSLAGERCSIPACLEVTAESVDDGEIMGIRHIEYPD